ncbi:MAG: 30S ribosomal protein S5 [Candidatus Nealsonbacteria bacterium]|nr:30S ribosomal protein S5 [Candidatus Nealsonbacteria bacterium]
MADVYQKNRGPRRGFKDKKDEFDSKLLDLSRVSRMSAGGRRFRFRAAVIIGDQKGRVALGVAKGADVAQSIDKATVDAKKNIVSVPILNETIPHQVEAKYSAARILLKPQSKGRGLVAGGTVRVICSMAGIRNISSKVLGRTGNKINNAKATLNALKKLKVKIK